MHTELRQMKLKVEFRAVNHTLAKFLRRSRSPTLVNAFHSCAWAQGLAKFALLREDSAVVASGDLSCKL